MSGWTFPSTPLIHLELSEFDHLDNLGNEESTGVQCLFFHFDRRHLSTQESTLLKYTHIHTMLIGFWGPSLYFGVDSRFKCSKLARVLGPRLWTTLIGIKWFVVCMHLCVIPLPDIPDLFFLPLNLTSFTPIPTHTQSIFILRLNNNVGLSVLLTGNVDEKWEWNGGRRV